MARIDWTAKLKRMRRLLAAAPVVLAAVGVAMAASSTPRPEIDRATGQVVVVFAADPQRPGWRAGDFFGGRFGPQAAQQAQPSAAAEGERGRPQAPQQ